MYSEVLLVPLEGSMLYRVSLTLQDCVHHEYLSLNDEMIHCSTEYDSSNFYVEIFVIAANERWSIPLEGQGQQSATDKIETCQNYPYRQELS